MKLSEHHKWTPLWQYLIIMYCQRIDQRCQRVLLDMVTRTRSKFMEHGLNVGHFCDELFCGYNGSKIEPIANTTHNSISRLSLAKHHPCYLRSLTLHDDIIKWKHFPRYWPVVRGIHRSPPHKGQWRKAFMFSLIGTWTNVWVNNRDAGDLRRHSTHYDVTVMLNDWIIFSERNFIL